MSTQDKLTDIALSHVDKMALRIDEALELIERYGGIDGAHHKQWVLDQVVRKLCDSDESYQAWIDNYQGEADENGDTEYEWDEGCPP